jgi:transposase
LNTTIIPIDRIIFMKTDGRVHSHENLEFIRKNAVSRILAGESVAKVMETFGMHRTSAYPWLRREKKLGMQSLKSTKSLGPKRLLNDKQRAKVRCWICGKDPRQYGIDFGLWTRAIVKELILQRFGIEISISSVGVLLADLNITPQKPLQRAYQRDPVAITEWKTKVYPSIKRSCKTAGGSIFFLDEAGFSTDDTKGRTWSEKGKTPIATIDGRRQRINVISAVSANGSFWSKVYNGRLESDLFIDFLVDLMKRQKGPIYLILDSLPLHKSKSVMEFVDANSHMIKLYFLPTYAPELNPDELVWNYMKGRGTVKRPLRYKESLKKRVTADLRSIQRNRKLVRSFFQGPDVFYAAA